VSRLRRLVLSIAILGAAVAADDAEEASYQRCWKLFSAPLAEPEPPPGLRAPTESERYQRAAASYEKSLAAWEKRERDRRLRLITMLDTHLGQHPTGRRAIHARYLRGVTHYQTGSFRVARPDLEAFWQKAPAGPARDAARAALGECLRQLGDFAGALRVLGPTPEALEEAGHVARAIQAALAVDQVERAAAWRRIGRKLDTPLSNWPGGAAAIVVETGKKLAPERKEALRRAFPKKEFGFAVAKTSKADIYLLDRKRVIRAVNPRPDSLEHRIRALLDLR